MHDGLETFDDLALGAQDQNPALQCGDVLGQSTRSLFYNTGRSGVVRGRCDHRRQMGIDDCSEGTPEASVDRRDRSAASSRLLADALIDQHIGIHRHAHCQNNAGNPGKRQGRLQE